MTHKNGRLFRVFWPKTVRETIKKLAAQANLAGKVKELAAALRYFERRLSHEPNEVGEIYRKAGHVIEYLAAENPLSINFAVDTRRSVVVVRTAHLMGSP
ncbi:MAG TPA: hypothetical protein VE988_03460 [Gemmataceae bacterium]|nr:hypothetical protein [Gemmataceae bacterium]